MPLLVGESVQVGYIVSDLAVTGPERGTYKVWIPKKHWSPTNDFSGFGSNLGNLGPADYDLAMQSAEACYPMFPNAANGAKPFDPDTGIVSTDEASPDISADTAVNVTPCGEVVKGQSYHPEGDGASYYFRQTDGGESLLQTYTLGTTAGITANTRTNSVGGQMAKLDIGTKVVVMGNFITGMLPENQNDWINQFSPLNES